MSDNFLYEGRLIFGQYDMKYAKEGLSESEIDWFDLAPNHYYWTVNLGNIEFKNTENSTLNITSQYLILDSGMTYALIPLNDF